jgi:hypothetical protein
MTKLRILSLAFVFGLVGYGVGFSRSGACLTGFLDQG